MTRAQARVNRLSADNMALRDEVRQLHASLATTRAELYQLKEEIEFKLEQERKSQHAFLHRLAKQYNATN